jgi:hypothetical protein
MCRQLSGHIPPPTLPLITIVYSSRVTLMAAALSLILLAFVVVGVHLRCTRLPLFVIPTCCCDRCLWLATVGHDLGLASDPGPSAVGAVTLQLHVPAAVGAATLLLAQVLIEVT